MKTDKVNTSKLNNDEMIEQEYFIHGNVKIIISEHFKTNGKKLEDIIEEAILREARYATKNNDAT